MKVPVLIPRIFDHPHTYLSGRFGKLKAGSIVQVPFGREKEIGVVWDKAEETKKNFRLKSILEIKPFSFSDKLINFINWFSIYNLVPKGMVLKMFLGNDLLSSKKSDFKLQYIGNEKIRFELNDDQKKCLKDIQNFGNNFSVTLLQGITGSGKTLVYFERIKDLVDKGLQALILLPEIALTNQFSRRYKDFFGTNPAIWHSATSKKNKSIMLLKQLINITLADG